MQKARCTGCKICKTRVMKKATKSIILCIGKCAFNNMYFKMFGILSFAWMPKNVKYVCINLESPWANDLSGHYALQQSAPNEKISHLNIAVPADTIKS